VVVTHGGGKCLGQCPPLYEVALGSGCRPASERLESKTRVDGILGDGTAWKSGTVTGSPRSTAFCLSAFIVVILFEQFRINLTKR
jgi:hypothetical protein